MLGSRVFSLPSPGFAGLTRLQEMLQQFEHMLGTWFLIPGICSAQFPRALGEFGRTPGVLRRVAAELQDP